jgi:hypothetical protein
LFLAEDFRDVDLVDDAEVVTKIRSAFHEFAKWWIDNQKAGAARTEFIARLTRVLELLIRGTEGCDHSRQRCI